MYMAQPQPFDPFRKWSDTIKEPPDDGMYMAQPGAGPGAACPGGMAPFVVAIPHHTAYAAIIMPGAMAVPPGYGSPAPGGGYPGNTGPGYDAMPMPLWRMPGFWY